MRIYIEREVYMKYFKQVNDAGNIVALSMVEGDQAPDGVIEISEVDYNAGMDALAKADAEAKAAREAKAKADAEAAEKEWRERQDTINDYVSKVQSSALKLEEVPEEYRAEVDRIVNPPAVPPTNEELDKRLEASESAIDFLMTTVAGGVE